MPVVSSKPPSPFQIKETDVVHRGASQPSTEFTQLLISWREGDEAALGQLFPLVYKELRRLAAAKLVGERGDHTLQPTALVTKPS